MDASRLKQRLQEGQALVRAGHLDDAEQHYLRLLADYPHSSSALLHLGNIYILRKRWGEAIKRLRAGTTIDPASRKLRTSLARALFNEGEVAEATALLEQEQGDSPDPKALLLLQQCYSKLGNWPAVEEMGARLLSSLPANDPTWSAVSDLRDEALAQIEFARFQRTAQSSDFEAALVGLRDVESRHPADGPAWHAKHRVRLTKLIIDTYGDDEVLSYVQAAIASGSADAESYHWIGKSSYDRHEWDAAREGAENALALDPQHKSARFLLAKSLMRLNRLSEALDQLDLLLKEDPNRIAALQLKADIFVRLAHIDDAIRLYRTALRKDRDNPLFNHRLSNALLLKGDIAGYHRLHEHRRRLGSFIQNNKDYPFSDWNGELHIEGKLLVWSEFGLGVGQNILHMSFLNSLVALGLEVVFEVEPRLVELCQRSFPNIAVVANDTELPAGISHHTPVASLARWFKPDLPSFESMRPYFLPDLQTVQALRKKLQDSAGEGQLLVGISWTSNNPLVGDVKSIPLDQLLASLSLPELTLVNLQYGEHSESIQTAVARTGTQLMDSGIDTSNDLDGLAALVAALDLVVCIGHTTAHVAGAVGTPNFVLLPVGPFAHWLAHGKKCIWYPASTLFRQAPIDQDWCSVLAEVRESVGDFRNQYRPEDWLSTTLLQDTQPTTPATGILGSLELREAAECFSAQGAFRSALELIDRIPPHDFAEELQMKRADLLAQIGSWQQAKDIYSALQAAHGSDAVLASKLLAVNLDMYDLEAALPLAASLAEEEPTNRLTVANILHRMRRNEDALGELRAFSAAVPESDSLSTLTGTVLLEMREFNRAQAYLGNQAAVKPLPQAYALLGQALSAQDRREEALAAYNRALSLSPSHPIANFWRTQERVKSGSASLVPLPPVEGEISSTSTDDLVVFFVADSAYFWRYGLVLLESIARNSVGVRSHVHLINPDQGVARGIEITRGLLPGLKVSYSYETVDFDRANADYIRTYYASVRFVRLAEVFARCPATYLCVDADCIVRKNLLAGRSTLTVEDVAIRMRYDDRPNLSVAAGALALCPTAAAGEFINRAAAFIRSTLEAREAVWFLDQVVLSNVVRELGGGLSKVDQLDIGYVDWFFRDESLIWTGKGKRKSEDARYTREAAKYRSVQENCEIMRLMEQAGETSQT